MSSSSSSSNTGAAASLGDGGRGDDGRGDDVDDGRVDDVDDGWFWMKVNRGPYISSITGTRCCCSLLKRTVLSRDTSKALGMVDDG